ncbi:MAG: cytochrome c [Pseudomonadota bacterium]
MFNPSLVSRSTLLLALFTSTAFAEDLTFDQAQADAGKALYKETCQICHGSSLANGQFGTPLRGKFFQDKWKGKSVGELATFVFEKMPPDKVMSLSPEQTTAAVAYILSRNELAVSATTLNTDRTALNSVMLPW